MVATPFGGEYSVFDIGHPQANRLRFRQSPGGQSQTAPVDPTAAQPLSRPGVQIKSARGRGALCRLTHRDRRSGGSHKHRHASAASCTR
jgi:hypothetical protein